MLPITAQLLVVATGCTREIATTLERPISDACMKFEINTGRRVADFLAQIGHESASFEGRVENLNYSASRMVEVWPLRITPEQAKSLAHNPPALANVVYAGRNGNTISGDGWRYRGRGFIGVTGRGNYRAVTDLLREAGLACPDFVQDPDALAEIRWAVLSASAIWQDRDCNELADAGDFVKQTIRINGAKNGLADREARRARAVAALQGVAP